MNIRAMRAASASSRRTFVATLLASLLVLSACPPHAAAQADRTATHATRVLFIGNSYTYFSNLPEIFTRLAEAGHQGEVQATMVAPGGWRLKDHWEKGAARGLLRPGKWDYVVLQEQSTLGVNYYVEGKTRVAGDEIFRPYADKWAAEIRGAGATAVFYLTWARKATPEDQAALNHAYMRAAREGRALVAPVGIAWAQVREREPSLELFSGDGSHPSPAGSYLAACTLYATLFHRSPKGLPGRVSGPPVNPATGEPGPERTAVLVDLPPDEAQLLQVAAWAAVRQLEKNGGYLDVSPVPVPAVAPLPAGAPLSAATLEGTWTGSLLFYPSGPAEMVLRLYREAETWKGHLELRFHAENLADESFDLTDLQIGDTEVTFADPKSVQGLKVHFRGVGTEVRGLRGIAEATLENPESPVQLLGTWHLRKQNPASVPDASTAGRAPGAFVPGSPAP
jgi:hypothetical protein